MCFLLFHVDVIFWMRWLSVSVRKITLSTSKFVFVEDLNSWGRDTHECHENWATLLETCWPKIPIACNIHVCMFCYKKHSSDVYVFLDKHGLPRLPILLRLMCRVLVRGLCLRKNSDPKFSGSSTLSSPPLVLISWLDNGRRLLEVNCV